MSPGTIDVQQLETARWRLLAASDAADSRVFSAELALVAGDLSGTGEPCWDAWAAAFTARAALLDGDVDAAAAAVATARAALERCHPTSERALTLAYLAHVEVAADRFDAALHLAVDASLLADQVAAEDPSRPLHQAHHWLSLALTRLDLEELAVAQALRGVQVAAALPDLGDQWQLLRLCAQQHAELAQTVHRRGEHRRCAELADVAVRCATAARELPWEPTDADSDLLDVVQAWAMTLRGELDDALPPLRRVRRHLGVLLQSSGLPGDLTVAETLQTWAGTLTAPRPVAEALAQVQLADRADRRVRSLSGGERRRLDLALALLGRPRVVVLDEPTTGLDPESRRQVWRLVRELVADGAAVVLTTHHLEEAEELADRVAVLRAGQIVLAGTQAEIAETQPATIRFTLDDDAPQPPRPAAAQVVTEGRRIEWHTRALQPVLAELLAWAAEHGVVLRALEARAASLEQAFLAVAAGTETTPSA
ncbi:ATP-binding cassette domain-containing protein [Modestobacter versicolor]|uniref:ABC transporter domain-containing protein n=1 Tax=Modestobacter versicolor TaxID=429133 RepID=A0A323VHP7_9ACTN|nr:ABC transporter ATP-binding protein [Modestobacter versicolor]PZA23400.1 hypothetical protein DMO24_00185 [Modestobacter versicolor]